MGLKIKEIIEKKLLSSLSINDDLPIKLDINMNEKFEEVLHYEIVTDNDSFFEIEILKDSGAIKSILLINCNEKDIKYTPELFLDLSKVITGEPLIDTSIFVLSESQNYFERFYREKEFKLLIAKNGIEIRFNINNLSKRTISIGGECFLGISDENKINSFIIIWASENQKQRFKESIYQ
ncbi:MAG TPA: hypothetical protein VL021_01370 [Brumimicrobium sp.]|nr:hypothetical protein [Brumimicrobium sp.]